MTAVAILALALASGAPAQNFEVASVKPSAPGRPGMSIHRTTGGGITTENVTLRFLITFAYDLRDFQITGAPAWLSSDHWDIAAKPEYQPPPTLEGEARQRAMLQALLKERFGLATHFETKEVPVYALVVGKNGHKMQTTPEGVHDDSMTSGNGYLKGTKIDMPVLAKNLSNMVGRVVIDQSGLKGDFDFQLEYAPEQNKPINPLEGGPAKPEAASDSDRPSLFTAIQEQLGLRLEAKKGPVRFLVIDKVEKATEN